MTYSRNLFVALVVVLASSQARADFIYQNLTTEGDYKPQDGATIAGPSAGVGSFTQTYSETFTAAATAQLSDVLVAIWGGGSVGTNSAFNLKLTDSSSTLLESWTAAAPTATGQNVPVVDLISALHPWLTAGHNYTLTATPNNTTTFDAWEESANTKTQRTGGVDVIGATTATPEPGSMTLLGLGLSSFGALGWLKKRKAAAIAV